MNALHAEYRITITMHVTAVISSFPHNKQQFILCCILIHTHINAACTVVYFTLYLNIATEDGEHDEEVSEHRTYRSQAYDSLFGNKDGDCGPETDAAEGELTHSCEIWWCNA